MARRFTREEVLEKLGNCSAEAEATYQQIMRESEFHRVQAEEYRRLADKYRLMAEELKL